MFSILKAKIAPYSLLIKIILIVGVLAGITSYYFWSQSKISRLNSTVTQRDSTITLQRQEIKNIAQINADNAKIIKQLLEDKKQLTQIREELAKQKQLLDGATDDILTGISRIDPKLNGPVAPVLKTTIDQLQTVDRDRRGTQ